MMNINFLQSCHTAANKLFSDKTERRQIHRSRAGLLLALALLPLLVGVWACFPVPVGNPEKSRIDPSMSGLWLGEEALLVLDPYDKRTWLISYFAFSTIPDNDSKGSDERIDEGAGDSSDEGLSSIELLRKNRLEIDGVGIYKGWLTKIKKERFLTWESKTLTETLPDMVPEHWWVFRVRQGSDEVMHLDFIDPDYGDFDDIETRSKAEKFIRRHMNDPEFFSDDDSSLLFGRLSKGDYEAASELIEEFDVLNPL